MHWYLPGTKAGGPVRSVFSMISLLKDHFDFYIITSNKDLGSDTEYPGIIPNTLFEKEGVNYFYFNDAYNTADNLLALLTKIDADLIYLNSFWSFTFSINIIRLKNRKLITAPILLAPRGMLSKGALSLKSFKKNIYLISAKIFAWYKHVYFHATNKQEEEDIKARFRSAKITIASNLNSGTLVKNTTLKNSGEFKLFFLSRISEVKNLHFALEILKEIPADVGITYDIYGNLEDQNYWNRCNDIIKQLPKNVSVAYKGELAFNEVQKTIANYHALLLPTLNENFGHSIVESLLTGCSVIISDQTPWNDIEKNNAGYAVALDNKQGFIQAILQLAKLDENEFSQKSKAANSYISSKIEVDKSINLYKNLFNGFAKN